MNSQIEEGIEEWNRRGYVMWRCELKTKGWVQSCWGKRCRWDVEPKTFLLIIVDGMTGIRSKGKSFPSQTCALVSPSKLLELKLESLYLLLYFQNTWAIRTKILHSSIPLKKAFFIHLRLANEDDWHLELERVTKQPPLSHHHEWQKPISKQPLYRKVPPSEKYVRSR
jgi:hypothetical protein